MSNILTSLSLLGYCFFLRRFTRLPIEAAPFFIISSLIVVLYVFAYAGILQIGALSVLYLGGIMFLFAPIYLPKNKHLLTAEYFTPGLVVYLCAMIIFGIMALYIATTVAGDDIGRWMPHARWLYINKGFLHADDMVSNPDYPPGGALFYYYFSQLNGFHEQTLFFAQLFLLLSPLVILLKYFRWRYWALACLMFTLILNIYIHKLRISIGSEATTLMDNPTGSFFGGILASYFLLNNQRKLWIYLLPPVMAMVLFKPMVYSFTLLITAIIITDQFILRKANKQNIWPTLIYLLIAISPAAVMFTWQHHLRQINLGNTWDFSKLIGSIIHHTSPLTDAEYHKVLTEYGYYFKATKIFALHTMMYVLAICLCTRDKIFKYRILATNILLLLGYFVYSYMLLVFYLYQMGALVATTLNSYQRFMFVYNTGWIVVLIAQASIVFIEPLLKIFENKPLTNIALNLYHHVLKPIFFYVENNLSKVIYATLIIMAFSYGKTAINEVKINKQYAVQKKGWLYINHAVDNIAIAVKSVTGNSSRIGIIGSSLIPIFSYKLIPAAAIGLYGDLGTPENFASLTKGYDYLLLTNTDLSFWKHYGQYFSILNRKPFADLLMCNNKVSNPFVPWDCKHHHASIYLYKVEIKDGKLSFENMAA